MMLCTGLWCLFRSGSCFGTNTAETTSMIQIMQYCTIIIYSKTNLLNKNNKSASMETVRDGKQDGWTDIQR